MATRCGNSETGPLSGVGEEPGEDLGWRSRKVSERTDALFKGDEEHGGIEPCVQYKDFSAKKV